MRKETEQAEQTAGTPEGQTENIEQPDRVEQTTPPEQAEQPEEPPKRLSVGWRAAIRLCNILFTAILVVIILVGGGILVAKLLGYSPMVVLSGSMTPSYRVGDLVFIDGNVQAADVRIDDVIAFQYGEDSVVSHRVIGIDSENNFFYTKGDANDVADAPTPFSGFVGRACWHIPKIGLFFLDLMSMKGVAYGMILVAVLVILYAIPALKGQR